MRLSLSFLLLFLSSTANSQHFDPGLISILNNPPALTSPLNTCATIPSENIDLSEEMQHCAQALCGSPQENHTLQMRHKDFSRYATQGMLDKTKNILPLIQKVVKKEKNEKIEIINEILKAIKSNQFDNIELSQAQTLNFTYLLDNFIEIYPVHTNDYKNRLQAKFNFPSWMDQESRDILKKQSESTIFNMNNIYNLIAKKDFYSDSEINKILSEKIDKTEELIKNNPGLESPYLKNDLERIKNKLKNNSPITAIDFNFETSSQKLLKLLWKKSVCESADCGKFIRSYLKNTLTNQKLESLLDQIKSNDQTKENINLCQAKLIANLVQADNRKKANSVFQEAKTVVIEKVLPAFSNHSRGLILKELDKIKFNNDPFRSLTESEFSEHAKDYLRPVYSAPDNDKTNTDLLSSYIDFSLNNFDEMQIGPCHSMSVRPSRDSWNSGSQTISISDFSCIHDITGKHIMAHELGHALSSIFSELSLSKESLETYLNMRECVAGYYPSSNKGMSSFAKHDNRFTEEDMADFIANMAFKNNGPIASCAYLYSDESPNQYSKLTLYKEDSDVHSTNLHRVLIEAVNKGNTLPYSCNNLIEKTPNLDFKKCLK